MKQPIRKFYDFVSRPLYPSARIVLLLALIPLVLSFLYPLWRISLIAPQYPEGLYVDVYSFALRGGNHGQHLTEINTINHYIGMRHIDRTMLTDLDWMPFAIGVLGLLTLRVALIGDVRSLIDVTVLSGYVSAFAFARFYVKMYALGHDLDPAAPMHITPFTPPVFGSREIANFTSSSYPRAGALWLGLFLLMLGGTLLWHLIRGRVQAAREEKRASEPPAKPATTTPDPGPTAPSGGPGETAAKAMALAVGALLLCAPRFAHASPLDAKSGTQPPSNLVCPRASAPPTVQHPHARLAAPVADAPGGTRHQGISVPAAGPQAR